MLRWLASLACGVVLLAALLAAQAPAGSAVAGSRLAAPAQSPTPCPPPPFAVATAEPFWVEPVTSPTTLLTQTVTVYLGRGVEIEIGSEAGTVITTGHFIVPPAHIVVPLLPGVTHHLGVTGTVEYVTGCTYTLHTSVDRYGGPLTIVQQSYVAYVPAMLVIPGTRR